MYHKDIKAGFLFIFIILISSPIFAEQPAPLKAGELSSAADCGSCHKEIYEMWKSSLHSRAVSDPVFQASYMEAYLASKGEDKKLCLKCHSPGVMINGDYDLEDPKSHEGISCHFCHSMVDADPNADPQNPERFKLDIGRTIRSPRGSGTTPYHDYERSQIHKKSQLCAGCHEYSANGIHIMGTYTEWLNSSYAEKGIHCQNCHMPLQKAGNRAKGKTFSHYLAGGHSLAQLKSAITTEIISLTRKKDRVIVEAMVENSGSGHSVPTGIPSRKLILTCKITNQKNISRKRVIKYEKIIFDSSGRELLKDSEIMAGVGSQIVKDNRIAPGEKRKEKIVFYIEPEGEFLVSVTVDYLYKPEIMQEIEMKMEMNRDEKAFLP